VRLARYHFTFEWESQRFKKIVREICKVTWNFLQDERIPKPANSMWRETATSYWKKLNFPNCIGSLDGKHISKFYNYK
jgi:hypothetical protein